MAIYSMTKFGNHEFPYMVKDDPELFIYQACHMISAASYKGN